MNNRFLDNRQSGVVYLLNDEFTIALAAGAVDGTSAVPGPGTRDGVVDTNNKLSITGGNLTFATGGAAADDPRNSYLSITRTAGRIFVAETNFSNLGVRTGISKLATAAQESVIRLAGTSAQIDKGAGSFLTVGVIAADTQYYLAIALRSTGEYAFIKGGTFTNWTLLWTDDNGNTATLYPYAGADDTSSIGTMSFIRIPDALWIPSPELSDGFSGTNGTLLNARNSDGLGHAEGVANSIGKGGGGLAWTDAPDQYTITGGKLICTPVAGANLVTNGDFAAWTADDPDGWAVTGEVGADPEISQVGTGQGHGGAGTGMCNFYSSATSFQPSIAQTILTANTWYRTDFDVDTAISGGVLTYFGSRTAPAGTIGTGSFIRTQLANGTGFSIKGYAAAIDVTIDNVTIKALTLPHLLSLKQCSTQDGLLDADLVVAFATQVGLAMNWDDPTSPANGIVAYHDGTNAVLLKNVAGTWTQVIAAAATYSANAKMRIIKSGTSYSLYYNNAQVGSTSTISDVGVKDNKYHGAFSTYSSNTIDDVIFRPRTHNKYDTELNQYIG
jgi:hypothetical protein